MTNTLTKKQKADIFAWALDFGWNDYFDQCEWIPSQHKYRYVCAQEDRTYYLTQKELARDYDTLTKKERKQLAEDYFSTEMEAQQWND